MPVALLDLSYGCIFFLFCLFYVFFYVEIFVLLSSKFKQFKKRLANKEIKDWMHTPNDLLCSKHFEESLFHKSDIQARIRFRPCHTTILTTKNIIGNIIHSIVNIHYNNLYIFFIFYIVVKKKMP